MDRINKIKIRLCVFIWIAVAVAVIVTVFITKNASCLWAFLIPAWITSESDLINFSVKVSNNDADEDSKSDYCEEDDTEAEVAFRNYRIR